MRNLFFAVFVLIFSVACSDLHEKNRSASGRFNTDVEDLLDPLRPQFHFTADSGFLSDPNGLVYYQGDYHLFHQYNPFDNRSGVPQHWAHAVSCDLIHWKRLPIAIYPHGGGNIWSGSAVVDKNNSSGLQSGTDPPIVAFYTWNKDFSQRMTYSNDGGDSWEEYKNNPVVGHIYESNRDPKVFWHEASGQWIMILYVRTFEIFVSQNLIDWTNTCSMELEGFHECPDFFELPVEGHPEESRWVVVDAAGRYYTGDFNGTTFTPEGSWHYSDWNPRTRLERTGKTRGEFYATQTWSNMPPEDGRRIQIAAMRDGNYRLPKKTFHNQMTFPCELSLRHTEEGIRMYRWPIGEIENLYDNQQSWKDLTLKAGESLILGENDLLDITATLELPPSHHETTLEWLPLEPLSFQFHIRGIDIHYDVRQEEISCQNSVAPLSLAKNNSVELRILVDRLSLEIFGNQGEISISTYANMDADNHRSTLECTGGAIIIKELKVNTLTALK